MDRKWSRWSYRWCSQLDHHSYRPTLACRPPLLPKEQYQNVHSLECKGRRGILPIAWFSVLRLHKVRSSLLLGFLNCMLPFCRGSIQAWTRGWLLACFIYRKMLAHLLSSFKCSTFSLILSSNPPAKISLDTFFASESFVVRNRAYACSAKLRFFFLSKRLMERKDLLMWISDYLSIICMSCAWKRNVLAVFVLWEAYFVLWRHGWSVRRRSLFQGRSALWNKMRKHFGKIIASIQPVYQRQDTVLQDADRCGIAA